MLRADASRPHRIWTPESIRTPRPSLYIVFLILPLFRLLPFQIGGSSRTRLCNSNELPGTKQPSMLYCVQAFTGSAQGVEKASACRVIGICVRGRRAGELL